MAGSDIGLVGADARCARLQRPMRSTYRSAYGPPDVLDVREFPVPHPGPGEVLVRVHAATVSRTDSGVLRGAPYVLRFMAGWPRPRRNTTGTDFAREVVAVGDGAARFEVGDRVMGFNDVGIGSHAEYLILTARDAATRVPAGVDLGVAAASMEGAHYARNFINKVPLKAGDSVLVYGATGAIGSAAVALLEETGAVVTAVCQKRHHAAVEALGAETLLDHTEPDWMSRLGERSFDYVFDAVGKLTLMAFRPVIKATGAYVSSELGPWSQNLFYAMAAPVMRGPKVRFPFPSDIQKTLDLLCPLLESGRYTPLIDRRYDLDHVHEAFEYVESGQKIGNVLLMPTAGAGPSNSVTT